MHLLRVDTVSLDEGEAAVDLGQAPGDVVALSFTDSDLAGLAQAYASLSGEWPSLRLAKMAQLRHPLSVDLYADAVIARARFVLVRCLGGLDYWRYGLERLAATCRAHGIPLAVLPGCDRPDPRLAEISTVTPALRDALDGYVRAGGPENLRRLLVRIAAALGHPVAPEPPEALPRGFAWCPGCGPLDAVGTASPLPRALVVVYRSAILGGDTARPPPWRQPCGSAAWRRPSWRSRASRIRRPCRSCGRRSRASAPP